jgi:hypothetical protein
MGSGALWAARAHELGERVGVGYWAVAAAGAAGRAKGLGEGQGAGGGTRYAAEALGAVAVEKMV